VSTCITEAIQNAWIFQENLGTACFALKWPGPSFCTGQLLDQPWQLALTVLFSLSANLLEFSALFDSFFGRGYASLTKCVQVVPQTLKKTAAKRAITD
jgi:hypothetical protein